MCDIRFHQIIKLPPNPEKGRSKSLRISYSDYSYRGQDSWNPEGETVALLCGALMGTRFYYYAQIGSQRKTKCKQYILTDLSIGGSDPVKLGERISVWLGKLPPANKCHLFAEPIDGISADSAAHPKKSVRTSALYRSRLIHSTPCGPARIPVRLHPTY